MKVKTTGMVRPLDPLGRVVIPKEIRTSRGWQEKDNLAIYTEGESVILRKDSPVCIFCGRAEDVTSFRGKLVCAKCLAELKNC